MYLLLIFLTSYLALPKPTSGGLWEDIFIQKILLNQSLRFWNWESPETLNEIGFLSPGKAPSGLNPECNALTNGVTNLNQLQPSVAVHIETSHFICSATQMTGFYMKYNAWLKWAKHHTHRINLFQAMFNFTSLLSSISYKQNRILGITEAKWDIGLKHVYLVLAFSSFLKCSYIMTNINVDFK